MTRPIGFTIAQLIEKHKQTRETILAQGYTPVEIDHPTRHGAKVWIAREFQNEATQVYESGCFTCGDRGFVTLDVPYDDPRHGQAVPCPSNCAAVQELKHSRDMHLYAAAKLPDEHRKCTLATFEAAIDCATSLWAGKELGYHAVKQFIAASANKFDVDMADIAAGAKLTAEADVRNSLILAGDYGVGKTGFAAAIVNNAIEAGIPTRYTRAMSFLNAVQNRYGMEDGDPYPDDEFGAMDAGQVVNVVQKVPLLVLDDFDLPNLRAESDKAAKMQDVIRYRHGWHLPTVITTNLRSMDEIDLRWGPTTATVLGQMAHFIPIGGEAMRPVPQMVGDYAR